MQITSIPIDLRGMETTQHGSPDFPIAVYRSILSRNTLGFIDWHWHVELQFCLVTEGAVLFSVSGAQYRLASGDGIFVNSGYLHMARPLDRESAYLCVDAHPALLSFFPDSRMDKRYVEPWLHNAALTLMPLYSSVEWQQEILTAVSELERLNTETAFGFEYAVCTVLASMWLSLLRHSGAEPKQGKLQQNAAAQRILLYLHSHFREDIRLEDIAREVSFSRNECCRLFKSVTGETIFSHLQRCRLEHALRLLRQSELSISDIAAECGFGSVSHFIALFRRELGTTPLQYRKTHCRERS